ncbi:hypothetical protein K525DRAFT_246468 [Schizophyllum commune Loenen D]|nr:hypothetical protein K525DRAFT_246468 [Schizophyllum commune Loenen D]
MQFFIALLYITALFFSCALAKDFDVAVGENAALNFNPSSLTGVQNGDTITFHFLSGNHTLTQSTFDEPCKAKEGGVDSGYQDVQNAGGGDRLHYTITVNNASTPLWFFCGQTGHCPRGMVFAVNPTADKTFADFQGTAKQVTPGSAENPDYVPSVTTNATMSGATANNGAVASIEYAVATNIVGPAIPQALRTARYELSEDLTGEVEERKDAFPETNEPARLDIQEKKLIYEYSKKVSRLEIIFTRRHKTRTPTGPQLTNLESLRFRRAIYETHRDFLDQYSTDGLREIQAVADFITELSHCVRREAAPMQHDIISIGHTQRETNSLTHRAYLENFHDFFLSCGPLAALECYEARSFSPIEDDAYSVIDSGVSDMAFCGFVSQPIALIMGARKAEYRSNHWRAILDSIPDEHATCDRCRTMKGLELYDETNYDALFGVEGLNHRELPRLFKGRLGHHFTERHKIWEYFEGAASFDYGAFLKEIFAFSKPLAASTPVTPAPSTVVAPAPAPVISQSLSLEEWAEAVDDDEGSASGTAAIDQPAASSSTASSSLCSPWDGLSTSSALCADCLKDVISECLPQWWLERKRNAGETIPTEDCWYGWNCRTQTHKPLHATRLNHFCKPSRGDGV